MLFVDKVYAQTPNPLGTIGGPGLGPFAQRPYGLSDGVRALTDIAGIVSSVVGIMTIAAGIWFLIQVLVGGFNWMTSGGDKAKLEAARHRITDAFVGLIVVVAGWAILAIAAMFFNVDFLLTRPGETIQQLDARPN